MEGAIAVVRPTLVDTVLILSRDCRLDGDDCALAVVGPTLVSSGG
jgi:hypothetical protein